MSMGRFSAQWLAPESDPDKLLVILRKTRWFSGSRRWCDPVVRPETKRRGQHEQKNARSSSRSKAAVQPATIPQDGGRRGDVHGGFVEPGLRRQRTDRRGGHR